MRVNVDSKVLGDPRFRRLGHALRISWREALGIAVVLWLQAYENRSAYFGREDVDLVVEREGFAAALISSDLAEDAGDGRLRLRGVTDRIAFLEELKERGRRGGRKSSSRRRGEAQGEATAQADGSAPAANALKHSHVHDHGQPQNPAPARSLERGKDAPARESKSGDPMPKGWKPDRAAHEVADQLDVDINWEADKFRDYALAKGKRSADWQADFRLWLKKAPGFNGDSF